MKTIIKRFVFSLVAIALASVALADVAQSLTELSNRDWQVRRSAAEALGTPI
jgi:hypothetical protein